MRSPGACATFAGLGATAEREQHSPGGPRRAAALGTDIKEFASRGIPWIIEASGFDYCNVDHEPGAFDLETIADLAGWFRATNVSPIVRIHKSFIHLIPGILDQGIMGIQVSEVDNAEEARDRTGSQVSADRQSRHRGARDAHRLQELWCRHLSEYAPWANANIIVCPSIESLEGLDNVEAIAAVEGIDMIAYGHSDLSARLGIHLELDHPRFKAIMRRIAEACNWHDKLARGSAETEAQIEEHWRLGCRVLNLPGNDVSTYLDGLKARAGRAHARLTSIGVPIA
jgi:2-keto-3-deoxy-L-rhamnonate aldolase RhmA